MNIKAKQTGKRVLIGLTGRMSSCVAAYLLKKQGFDVIGVTVVTGSKSDYGEAKYAPKCHINDIDIARNFAKKINIPFYATDIRSEFQNDVIDPMLASKLTGQANNSCFNCSRLRIKTLFSKMEQLDADFIATGHFCKVSKNLNTNDYFIHANADPLADQSYLLSGLEQNYLRHLLLPLGELKNEEVLKIGSRFSLAKSQAQEDKQFCFRNKKSYMGKVVSMVAPSLIKSGKILNIDTNTVIGEHEGIVEHFISEQNFNSDEAGRGEKSIEIVGFDVKTSTLHAGHKKNLTFKGVEVLDVNLGAGIDQSKPFGCFVKNKYSADYIKASLYFNNNGCAFLEFDENVYPLIPGESVTLFDRCSRNAKVIGNVILGEANDFELLDRVKSFRELAVKDEQDDLKTRKKPDFFEF